MSFALNAQLAAKRPPLPTATAIDPVTASIIRGALETVCYEATTHLGRAASSPIINQSNERNAAIVDAHGRLAMGSIGTPHLTFVSQLTVRYGLMQQHAYDWGPGDVFVGNDPDYGGGHLPDYNVYAPVYDAAGDLVLGQVGHILRDQIRAEDCAARIGGVEYGNCINNSCLRFLRMA